ncbi:ATP-binding protein [Novipirellula artificiosorum]|uniref:histidine kinase n=1 Tax=Novipirellula artificiosorum TaxID=2528016 RepID=A0A5C6DHY6_9BACT|nr:ATP-binding protein [Novipirellula artificiosorum]TWU36172.1 Sensory/regulatory protein RpfC [Novipirellula artificiosorum]
MNIFKRIPIRVRLSFGLVGIMTGTLLMASGLGFFPNEQEEILRGRNKLCESLAISGTAMASTGQVESLKVTLESILHRDDQVQSIGLVSVDGQLLVSAGPHRVLWNVSSDDRMTHMQVPVFRFGKQWGEMQVVFESTGGTLGLNYWAPAWLLIVLIPACLLQFSFFLRKSLDSLDPTGAVPTHVAETLNTFSVGLFLLDARGRVIFANRRLAQYLEMQESDILGKSIDSFDWIFPADAPEERPWNESRRTGDTVLDRNIQYDQTGRRLTFSMNCTTIGKQGSFVTFDDITLIEENKFELAKARDEAKSANEAKSSFLANMSHEIRTPLNAVLGFTDVLRRGLVTNSDEAISHLNMIHTSGAHLLELINDILDISKIEAGRLQVESIDAPLDPIITGVADVLRERAKEKQIELNTQFLTDLPRSLKTDPTRLRQVITNLVGNAIKFTDTGEVKIVTEMVHTTEGQNAIKIDVIDSGIGMTEEQQSKIFESFVQADSTTTRKFGGTGLGLSISRRLTEAMGGELTVTSEEGIGSTFSIWIPLSVDASTEMISPVEIERKAKQKATENHSGLTQVPHQPILVVDDGEANRRLIELVLSRAGAIVSTAGNGLEAIEKISESDYSLIFMDMQMPVLDGYSATRRLREAGLTTPIIALTGNAMKGDREKCLAAGCDDFLTKPVDIDKLLVCVTSHLGEADPCIDSVHLEEHPSNAKLSPALIAPPATRMDGGTTPIHPTLPMDDADFRAITSDFVGRLDSRLAAIEQAIGSKDFETVRCEAHWLKGAGGTVGLGVFTEPASALEQAAKRSECEQADRLLAQIRELHARVVIPATDTSGQPKPTVTQALENQVVDAAPRGLGAIHSTLPVEDRDFREIIIDFVIKLDTRIIEMRSLLQEHAFADLAEVAHWLKGAGGTVGYREFTSPAASLVEAARNEGADPCQAALQEIESVRSRIVVPELDPACD